MSELLPCTRYGPLRVPGGSDLISSFLRRYGEWSHIETDFVLGQVDRGARILDLGAFVGTFSLSMLRAAPSRVVAVEGNAAVFPLLRENLQRNCTVPCEAVHVVAGSAGHAAARPSFSAQDNLGASSFVSEAVPTAPEPGAPPPPEVLDLQQIRTRWGDFDLIKLDIEGAELQVLQSDADWLRAHQPVLWVECNESPESLPLFECIAGLGYSVHYLAYPSHNPDNFLRDPAPAFPVAYEAGLLAAPPGRPVALSALQRQRGCDLIPVRDAAHLRECLWVTPRWGLPQWVDIPVSRLLAICGHLQKQERFEDFLRRP